MIQMFGLSKMVNVVMRFRIVEVKVKQALSVSGLPDIDYALNPYLGCAHGCMYCYAKMYTRVRDVVDNWGKVVVVKKNIADVLRKEVRTAKKGVVGIGTITDPYQPAEAIYKLSRKCIEILAENGFKMSIQTKSSLILRDLDIFKRHKELIDIGITITSVNLDSPMKFLEPYSSPPSARVYALKKVSSEGIRTWIFYGPVVPGYNDSLDEIIKVLKIAKETGSEVYIDKLRVKKFMWYSPHLKALASESLEYNWGAFFGEVADLCKSLEVRCRMGFE